MNKYHIRTCIGNDLRFYKIYADDVIFKNGLMQFLKLGPNPGLVAAFPKKKTIIEEITKR